MRRLALLGLAVLLAAGLLLGLHRDLPGWYAQAMPGWYARTVYPLETATSFATPPAATTSTPPWWRR